ncbi:MAG: long-chain fatty acid--CoA ligase [Lentimicrobiaceae bacterium]|jgi:long-chain acyl-CoA synthetase
MPDVTRLFDILPHYAESFKPKDDVLAGKDNGKWIKYSISDYISNADNISYGLMKLGIKPGDNIATISGSRPEWNLVDMGIQQVGAIHVPIYPTISESDYKYILEHAEVKVIFITGREIYRKIEHLVVDLKGLLGVYSFKETDGVKHLDELILLGKENAEPVRIKEIKDAIKPNDLATIIYTSGTTGNPKGVMLTHFNIISNILSVKDIPPVGEEGRAISYLPLCHIYERVLVYLYQYVGISVYYAESPATVADNLREIKPDIFSTVPRLLEKVYERIINSGRKLTGIKKIIFFWAVNVGMRYELNGARGPYYTLKLNIARKLVFSKWQEALGGNLKVIVSAGAALQPRLAHIFWAAGIPVLEGYGLTETSPVIAVSTFEKDGVKFGTVGPIINNVTVKIAEDHEILCKGPGVMQGYYKEPALTDLAIDTDGWFHTGDLGQIEPEGQLKITGRKKEIFKTSFGKYVSPEMVENRMKESEFIDVLMVVGENQKYAAAIIVPDFIHLRTWCEIKGISYTTNKEMIALERIQRRYLKEIHKYNKQLGATEQIKAFELLDKEWTVDSGELTATLKLRRSLINERYKPVIEKLF